MKKLSLFAAIISLGAVSALAQQAPTPPPSTPGLTLTTTAFTDGGIIPNKYTQNALPTAPVSPALAWTNVPNGTVSFVLIMHDPDVTRNKAAEDILHWMVLNIPGTARSLAENVPTTPTLPDGSVQTKNTNGDVGFRGPGAGAAGPYHHYNLELFALDIKLSLGPDATRAEVLKAVDGHVLGKGVVVGRFHR